MIERNRIYNGDCVAGLKDLLHQTRRPFADCIITDPPYLNGYQTNHRQDKEHKFNKPIKNDDNPQIIIDVMPLLYAALKDNCPFYMFCGSDKVDFFKAEVEKYFTFKNLIVWGKGNHTAGDLDAQYGKCYEFIIYANKGRAPFNPGATRYDDIWRFARVTGKEQIHQNQKPLDLLSRIINQHTKPGDLILDPFMGSCALAVAAYRLQRDYIGYELDPDEYAAGTGWLDAVKAQGSLFDLLK